MTARGDGTHVGDLARRVVYRREKLGLTRDEVAQRAGMDSGYLDYLEHSPGADVSAGALVRLAFALETTVTELAGGNVDRPPGTGRAGPHPSLEVLSREQCEAHLAAGGIGRFVFLTEEGPVALPVNFRFIDGDIVFRTDPRGSPATAAGATASFEVDHIDEAASEGWSILITGYAARVDDPSSNDSRNTASNRGPAMRVATPSSASRPPRFPAVASASRAEPTHPLPGYLALAR